MKKVLTIFILSTIFIASSAFAVGNDSSGGGNAVLCYLNKETRNQVFKSLASSTSPFDYVDLQLKLLQAGFKPQLLDLWDARKPVGFPDTEKYPILEDRTPEEIYAALLPIIESLGKLPAGDDFETVRDFLERTQTSSSQWQAEENGVIRIDDMTIQSLFPANCLVAQVAFYDGRTNIVHYDARILRLMEKIDQNALRVHEDIYHAVRVRRRQLERALESLQIDIAAAYNSQAYKNGAAVDVSGVAILRKAIDKTQTSDLTRQLVANLFTSKVFGDVTSQKLAETILY